MLLAFCILSPQSSHVTAEVIFQKCKSHIIALFKILQRCCHPWKIKPKLLSIPSKAQYDLAFAHLSDLNSYSSHSHPLTLVTLTFQNFLKLTKLGAFALAVPSTQNALPQVRIWLLPLLQAVLCFNISSFLRLFLSTRSKKTPLSPVFCYLPFFP